MLANICKRVNSFVDNDYAKWDSSLMLFKLIMYLSLISITGCATVYRDRMLVAADNGRSEPYALESKDLKLKVIPPRFLPNDILIGPLVPVLPSYPIDAYVFDVNRFIRKPSVGISFENSTKDFINVDLSDLKIHIDDNEVLKPCEITQDLRSELEVEKNIQWATKKNSGDKLVHSVSPGISAVSLNFCRNSTKPGKVWRIEIPKIKIKNAELGSKNLVYNFTDTYHFELFRISK